MCEIKKKMITKGQLIYKINKILGDLEVAADRHIQSSNKSGTSKESHQYHNGAAQGYLISVKKIDEIIRSVK